MKDTKNYLSQKELFEEIIRCQIEGKISERLGGMFLKLSTKYANHNSFVRYVHLREDLIAAGAMACCNAYDKFRPFKDKEQNDAWDGETIPEFNYLVHNNAFAFMTTVAHNSLLQLLKKEYNFLNVVNATRLEEGYDASYGYTDMIADKEAKDKLEAELSSLPSDSDEDMTHLSDETLWKEDERTTIDPRDEQIEW